MAANQGSENVTTPQAIDQRCKEALECCDNDAHRTVILAAFAAVRADTAARIAELEHERDALSGYITARTAPRQGIEPQYDQSDADAFYLAEDNRKLKQRAATLEQALRDVRQLLDRFNREGGHGIPEHEMMRDRIAMVDRTIGASHVP